MSSDWRTAAAEALEAQAAAIAACLVELDNVHAVLEQRDRDRVCTELRAVAASLRAEASDMAGEARELRATRGQRDGFPLQLTAPATTRHPRGDHR